MDGPLMVGNLGSRLDRGLLQLFFERCEGALAWANQEARSYHNGDHKVTVSGIFAFNLTEYWRK
jgi:hypothetical protein